MSGAAPHSRRRATPLAVLFREAEGSEEFAGALQRAGVDAAFVPLLGVSPANAGALEEVRPTAPGWGRVLVAFRP